MLLRNIGFHSTRLCIRKCNSSMFRRILYVLHVNPDHMRVWVPLTSAQVNGCYFLSNNAAWSRSVSHLNPLSLLRFYTANSLRRGHEVGCPHFPRSLISYQFLLPSPARHRISQLWWMTCGGWNSENRVASSEHVLIHVLLVFWKIWEHKHSIHLELIEKT